MKYNLEGLLVNNKNLFEDEEDIELLPMCHVTTLKKFLDIIDDNAILNVSKSSDFKEEELIFFFYGSAEYLHRKGEESKYSSILNSPVAIVIDVLSSIKRIIPFDSGAYCDSRYGDLKESDEKKNMDINSYCIECNGRSANIDSLFYIKKYIKIFYRNNHNYLIRNLRNMKVLKQLLPLYEILDNILYLHNEKDKISNYDARAFTLEIQYNKNINLLRRSGRHYFVLPRELLTNKETLSKLVGELELTNSNNIKEIIELKTYTKDRSGNTIPELYVKLKKVVRREMNKLCKQFSEN